uniref:Uncharacterized protein n=1 Tax=Pipistrellus kuhlii TaxID=59472 RepID=A0A7J7R1Q7_PIPKU|nr:hypothetical protein mPipKuh1_007996 [Pipistrellus kuhlii]
MQAPGAPAPTRALWLRGSRNSPRGAAWRVPANRILRKPTCSRACGAQAQCRCPAHAWHLGRGGALPQELPGARLPPPPGPEATNQELGPGTPSGQALHPQMRPGWWGAGVGGGVPLEAAGTLGWAAVLAPKAGSDSQPCACPAGPRAAVHMPGLHPRLPGPALRLPVWH